MALQPEAPQQQDAFFQGMTETRATWLRVFWRRFRRNKLALIGLTILIILSLSSILAPVIAPFDPEAINLRAKNLPPDGTTLLGTDELGRDVLTRLLYGGRVSLMVAVLSVSIYVVVGGTLGALAGFFGGKVDNAIMRMADVILAFPFLLLALTIAAIRGPSVSNLIIAICVLAWPVPARLVRAEFLSLREREFVEAARATGASPLRIITRHMIPHALFPIIVQATLAVAGVILVEAALSYLGFGVKPGTPSWGNMLSSAQSITILREMPWQWIPPGVTIFLTVLSINFVGDALRDALDPRLKT